MSRKFLVAGLLALVAACASAQPEDGVDPAHRGASLAQVLVERGEHAEAVRELRAALPDCDEVDADDECRGRLRFALGWVERRWAASLAATGTEGSREHLLRAAEHLELAQTLLPGRREIVAERVLSLRDLGRVDEALTLWRDQVTQTQVSQSGRAEDRILLGDLEGLAGDDEVARTIYFEVEPSRPDDLELHRRILSTYRRSAGDPQVHRAWCRRLWQRDLDILAITGLEALLANEGDEDQDLVDWVLLHWTDLETQTGGIEPSDLARLPAAAEGRGLDELERLVQGPSEGLQPETGYSWWRRSPLRRHVAAEVLRLRSQREEYAARAEDAVRVLESATQWAPTPEEYERSEDLAGRPVAWVDARTDLVALYHRLDADEEFRRLMADLPTRGGSVLGPSLGSTHRFHTVLGVVLFDRQRWRHRSAGALYQLERAIETSAALEEQNRALRPVPALHRYLGLARTAVGDAKEASRSFFEAAQGYLDLDDLDTTENVLGRISRPKIDGLDVVGSILRVRRAIEAGEVGADRLLPDLARGSTWLGGAEADDLSASFLRRQRFKVISEVLDVELAAGGDLATDRRLQRLATLALEVSRDLDLPTRVDDNRKQHLGDGLSQLCGTPPPAREPESEVPRIGSCSRRVETWEGRSGYSFCVCGHFPLPGHRSGILLDGRPLGRPLVATESALVFFLGPEIEPGEHQVSGVPGAGFGLHDRAGLRVVRLRYDFDQERFGAKRKAKLSVSVKGNEKPVALELRNHTPGVTSIQGGDRQIFRLEHGDQKTRKVKAPRSAQNVVFQFSLTTDSGSSWSCDEGSDG